ncbi:PrgI family mobile element protein [Desulfurispora thermophila]|uniref:PrgI family mobile element protein n=1 Tax=Desulfurispora thermophila TaxID=265470 RepID=UPI000362A43B|nr:PrgI family protein [Desulfurispora thermophila]
MRRWPVAFDLSGHESLIGGFLTLQQLVFIMGGGLLAVASFIFPMVIAIPLAAMWILAGVYLAFGRLSRGRPAPEALWAWWRYRQSQKLWKGGVQ